jgi:hypothetical protein
MGVLEHLSFSSCELFGPPLCVYSYIHVLIHIHVLSSWELSGAPLVSPAFTCPRHDTAVYVYSYIYIYIRTRVYKHANMYINVSRKYVYKCTCICTCIYTSILTPELQEQQLLHASLCCTLDLICCSSPLPKSWDRGAQETGCCLAEGRRTPLHRWALLRQSAATIVRCYRGPPAEHFCVCTDAGAPFQNVQST